MVDGLSSHSINTVTVSKVNKNIPFRGYHFNRPQVVTSTKGETCTCEYFADICDINRIVQHHMESGLPLPSIDEAIYGQLHNPGDFPDFVNRLNVAQSNFMSLPASLRAQFNNDIQQFAKYLSTASEDELTLLKKKHGLIKEAVTPPVGEQLTPGPIQGDVSLSDVVKQPINEVSVTP